MRLKLREIVENETALNILMEIKFPQKVSFRLSRLKKILLPEIESFNERRIVLAKEYGKQVNETEDKWEIPKDNVPKFNKELNTLLDMEIDIPFEKIKLEELGNIEIEPKNLIDFVFEE